MSDVREFSVAVKTAARNMAIAVNGGNWESHYTETQKIGWYLKVQWMVDTYGIDPNPLVEHSKARGGVFLPHDHGLNDEKS